MDKIRSHSSISLPSTTTKRENESENYEIEQEEKSLSKLGKKEKGGSIYLGSMLSYKWRRLYCNENSGGSELWLIKFRKKGHEMPPVK